MKSTEFYTVMISPFFNDFFHLIQKLIEQIHLLSLLLIFTEGWC